MNPIREFHPNSNISNLYQGSDSIFTGSTINSLSGYFEGCDFRECIIHSIDLSADFRLNKDHLYKKN